MKIRYVQQSLTPTSPFVYDLLGSLKLLDGFLVEHLISYAFHCKVCHFACECEREEVHLGNKLLAGSLERKIPDGG